MDKDLLQKVSPVYPLKVEQYEQYISDTDNTSSIEKINAMIQNLHHMGRLTNNVVIQWNTVMKWLVENGIETVADEKIADLVASGQFEEKIETAINSMHTNIQGSLDGFSVKLTNIAKDLNLKKDGTDNSSIINNYVTTVGVEKGTIIVANGTFNVSNNVQIPSNIDVLFRKGGFIKINAGATLQIDGDIIAGNYEIFEDGGGKIDKSKSASPYNLAWYKGDSINKRYDFAKRDFKGFRQKTIIFPKPYPSQLGTYDGGDGRVYWSVDGEILIDDSANASEWYFGGEFTAVADFDSFIKVQGADKPENVYFYGTLQINIPVARTVNYGVNICDGARINFYDQVLINGAKTSVKVGGEGQTNPSYAFFNQLQCSFFTKNAVLVDGTTSTASTSIDVNSLSVSSAQAENTDAVLIRGLVRNFNIGALNHSANEAKAGYTTTNVANVLRITSYGSKSIKQGKVGSIYADDANNIIKIDSESLLRENITGIKINNVHCVWGAPAFDIDYCSQVVIDGLYNNPSIGTIGSNAVSSNILNSKLPITDNGIYSIIEGFGKQSRGLHVIPSAGGTWQIGNLIRETTSDKIYVRVAKTGVDANDFKKISNGLSGVATILATTTTIVVNHGLGYLPADIQLTPRGNVGSLWATSVSSTTFTITCSTAPTVDTIVSWRVE